MVMEEQHNYAAGDGTCSRKRPRPVLEESSADYPSCLPGAPSKLGRLLVETQGLPERGVESDASKLDGNRVDSDNSPGIRSSIEEDLLNILDDADEPPIQGLDSVIRSFQEEILLPSSMPPVAIPDEVTSSKLGDWKLPELGHLREASDAELIFPPALAREEDDKVIGCVDSPAVDGHGGGVVDEEGISFDPFGFQPDGNHCYESGVDFSDLAELFNESDESGDTVSGLQWQPQPGSLSAS